MGNSMRLSRRSGRADGVATFDSAWHDPLRAELDGWLAAVIKIYGDGVRFKASLAIEWTDQWLIAYSQGWVSERQALSACDRASRLVPNGLERRVLLGIATHKMLLVEPRILGEHKAKTPPHLQRLVGGLVESLLFDDDDRQVLPSRGHAVRDAREWLEDLLDPLPSERTMAEWHGQWRQQEGKEPLKAGRPSKSTG